MNQIIVTVFTPTYNRGYILKQCYESLKKQTSIDFEWIIIDDGSTDDTETIVKNWLNCENAFSIKYIKTKNGGKHRAINKALDLAKGKLFLILDSDDYLTNDAIEKIIKAEKTIENSKIKFAGIAMSKGYSQTELVGKTFKGEYIDATSLERKKYNIKGDKVEVFYTDVLRKNKFPEFEGEKFVTEALIWNRIARKGYKLRWFQDIIYICQYREDGLTRKGDNVYKNSPKGLLLFIQEYISDFKLGFVKRCLQYELYSRVVYSNSNLKQAANDLSVSKLEIKIGVFLRKIINILK